MDLNTQKCKPCSGDTIKFNQEQISEYIKKINSWSVNDQQEMIFKKFKFKNFRSTMQFINKIALIAEQEGHHPDVSFGYGYCLVMIHTHAIKGLSTNDFILANKIDSIN